MMKSGTYVGERRSLEMKRQRCLAKVEYLASEAHGDARMAENNVLEMRGWNNAVVDLPEYLAAIEAAKAATTALAALAAKLGVKLES